MACQPICGKGPLRQIEIEIEAEVEIEIISLRRFRQFPTANSTPLGSSGRATKGRLFYVQYKSQLAPGPEVLCRTSAFQGRGLVRCQLYVLWIES